MNDLPAKILDPEFVSRHLMGPNSLTLLRELLTDLSLPKKARILDLGCGMGLTSLYLAKVYDAQVFACDLWISATENFQRFREQGQEQIIPIHADANALPFADGYFDAVVSVDAYHYFGREKGFLEEKLLPLVKPGGVIAIVVPGLKEELTQGLPPAMLLSWSQEDADTWHSAAWWQDFLTGEAAGCAIHTKQMESFEEPWQEWLQSDNPYAVSDRPAMEAGAGKYMNFVSMVIRKGLSPKEG